MNSSAQEDVLRNVFFDQYKTLDTEILAEFFSKVPNLKILFDNALTFENMGMRAMLRLHLSWGQR